MINPTAARPISATSAPYPGDLVVVGTVVGATVVGTAVGAGVGTVVAVITGVGVGTAVADPSRTLNNCVPVAS